MNNKNIFKILLYGFLFLSSTISTQAQDSLEGSADKYTIFDDKMLLDGYYKKHQTLSRDTLLEMIKDEALSPYSVAAAVRVFKENFADDTVASEKKEVVRILWQRLSKNDSPFVDVEIMHTLCLVDRYQYFESMVPGLLQKLDHYNATVNEMAYNSLNDLIKRGTRPREARIIFNTLRKMLFLSRKRLESITEPGPRLDNKLKILRWSIKILGNQEIRKLPNEVLNLL